MEYHLVIRTTGEGGDALVADIARQLKAHVASDDPQLAYELKADKFVSIDNLRVWAQNWGETCGRVDALWGYLLSNTALGLDIRHRVSESPRAAHLAMLSKADRTAELDLLGIWEIEASSLKKAVAMLSLPFWDRDMADPMRRMLQHLKAEL